MAGPVKRSVTIAGHRTSITLEPAFWDALREIATARGVTISKLILSIDEERSPASDPLSSGVGLSSAIRVFVLHWYRDQVSGVDPA